MVAVLARDDVDSSMRACWYRSRLSLVRFGVVVGGCLVRRGVYAALRFVNG